VSSEDLKNVKFLFLDRPARRSGSEDQGRTNLYQDNPHFLFKDFSAVK
jgi:hypothetical protein